MDFRVVGSFREVAALRKLNPDVTLSHIDKAINGGAFKRWYRQNKKVIHTLAIAAPSFAFSLFGITPDITSFLFFNQAVPAFAPEGYSFWKGHGRILLDMLIVGFVTLVVTTFLRFTGRGELAPLVMFVGGGIILYEVIGLFKDIYKAVASFFQL